MLSHKQNFGSITRVTIPPGLSKDENELRTLSSSPVQFNPVDANVFRGFGFPGADEYGNMFQVYRDFEKEVNAARSIEATRKLNPSLQNFDQWLAGHKAAVLAAANPAPATA